MVRKRQQERPGPERTDGRRAEDMEAKDPEKEQDNISRTTQRKIRNIADMHCDTLSFLETQQAGSLRENGGQLDLMRMRESGYLLQNFAIYVDMREHPDAWDWAMRLAERFRAEMEKNRDLVRQVRCWDDIRRNRGEGILCAMLTVEEGGICGGKLEKLRKLYDLGVRMMTLTWNYQNELAGPASPPEGTVCQEPLGLTEKGRAFAAEMESLGMILDVSHLSDEGFWNVVQLTKKPFVASHSNSRALCGHRRNLTDEMIRAVGERGGVIGLNFYEKFIREGQEDLLKGLTEHARRITDLGGMEVLGLGSDFDGIPANGDLPGAESLGLLWDALRRGGFTEGQLDKIFSENVLRVCRDVLK